MKTSLRIEAKSSRDFRLIWHQQLALPWADTLLSASEALMIKLVATDRGRLNFFAFPNRHLSVFLFAPSSPTIVKIFRHCWRKLYDRYSYRQAKCYIYKDREEVIAIFHRYLLCKKNMPATVSRSAALRNHGVIQSKAYRTCSRFIRSSSGRCV